MPIPQSLRFSVEACREHFGRNEFRVAVLSELQEATFGVLHGYPTSVAGRVAENLISHMKTEAPEKPSLLDLWDATSWRLEECRLARLLRHAQSDLASDHQAPEQLIASVLCSVNPRMRLVHVASHGTPLMMRLRSGCLDSMIPRADLFHILARSSAAGPLDCNAEYLRTDRLVMPLTSRETTLDTATFRVRPGDRVILAHEWVSGWNGLARTLDPVLPLARARDETRNLFLVPESVHSYSIGFVILDFEHGQERGVD